MAEGEFAEVVHDAFVGAVLFVNLQDARVLGVAGGKNARGLPGQKDAGVGAVAINETTDDKHDGGDPARVGQKRESRAPVVEGKTSGFLTTKHTNHTKAGSGETDSVKVEVCEPGRVNELTEELTSPRQTPMDADFGL